MIPAKTQDFAFPFVDLLEDPVCPALWGLNQQDFSELEKTGFIMMWVTCWGHHIRTHEFLSVQVIKYSLTSASPTQGSHISAGIMLPYCHHQRICIFSMLELSQELIVHPCRTTATFTWFSACPDRQLLSWEEAIFQNQPTLLEHVSFQDHLPWHLPTQTPQQWTFAFLRPRIMIVLFGLFLLCSISCSWHSPSQQILVYKSMRHSRATLISSLVSCVRKFSMHSGNFLGCLYSAVLPSPDIRWFKPP